MASCPMEYQIENQQEMHDVEEMELSYEEKKNNDSIPVQTSRAQAPFRILDLPPELRNYVYRAIVAKFESKSWKRDRHAKHIKGVFTQMPKQLVHFVLSCKTVWSELLSLLLATFIWVVDMRYHHKMAVPFSIYPETHWLLRPSTFAEPTSGNIRTALFKFEFRVPRCDPEFRAFELPRNRGVPQINRHIHWHVKIILTNTTPYYEVIAECRAYMTGGWDPREDFTEKSDSLRERLEQNACASLDGIFDGKIASGKSVRLFTIEEWHLVAYSLQSGFQEWFDGNDWKP